MVELASQDRQPVLQDGYAHTRALTIRNACNTRLLQQPPPLRQLPQLLTYLTQLFPLSLGGDMLKEM